MTTASSQELSLETLYDQRFIEDYLGSKMSSDVIPQLLS
jgi:hypothetical protein